jgi:ankyrin repeat protein
MRAILILSGALVCGLAPAATFAEPVSTPAIQASASRAIALLEKSIRVWHQNRTCYSCHHQALPIALVAEARTRGVPVDETLARTNISAGLQGLKSLDRAVQCAQQIDPALDTGSQLAAAKVAGIPPGLVREVYAAVVAKRQRADGGWDTPDNRPPQAWSRLTATAIALKAIHAYMPANRRDETEARTTRARDWLLAARPRDTEDRAFQLFGALEAGADRAALDSMATALVAEQRADGGWAQLPPRSSDAYATGEALVALFEAGVGPADPVFQRGLSYLLHTQLPDGSWRVETRMHEQALVSPPHFETGFPHGDDQMISVMGTAWATRALLRALPEHHLMPGPLVNAADWTLDEEAPWMPAALFGSAANLERQLTSGLDPNSRTAAGTSILMMAAGDREKVGALLTRGADVNLAAKTGFTPLMVAANDPDAAAAIRLLIEHGATVAPSHPKPLHDGTPLFFAVSSGNVEAVRLLLERGANPRAKMSVGGAFTATPIEMAVVQGDVPMVRALADAGVDLNAFNDAGIPPITSAVLSNRVDSVRALLSLGADVNLTDELSLTPLMHAALVDFGDTEIVRLLLAAGAKTDQTSKDDRTALDLARQHRHAAIVRLLEHQGN